jgi:hypothetical protein
LDKDEKVIYSANNQSIITKGKNGGEAEVISHLTYNGLYSYFWNSEKKNPIEFLELACKVSELL